jgi:tRNA(Ile)-lysidine synthase
VSALRGWSEKLVHALRAALGREAPARGDLWLAAFSGGPDSAALAAGLVQLAPEFGFELVLAHVDHRLDSGSGERAERARALAARLGLPFRRLDVDVPAARRARESPESAARRLRYAALAALARELGAKRTLTAHQLDDQVETILLRLLRGAPLEALEGIRLRQGNLFRPLLAVGRPEIEGFLVERGIVAVDDPTNLDLRGPRNLLRRHLLPRLRAAEPGLDEALLALARRSAVLRTCLESRFEELLRKDSRGRGDETGAAAMETGVRGQPPAAAPGSAAPVPAGFLPRLPAPLRMPALRWLLRERLGVAPLPSRPSMATFLSQLETKPGAARLELPRGEEKARRLVARRGGLELEGTKSRVSPFSYTFSIPGEVELPELGLELRIRRVPVEPWMFRGESRRAGLGGAPVATTATLRCRRPGDRIRPLGAPGTRKLKELLVDRRVAREERGRLPLVELAGRIAWVPGVAIDEAFRLVPSDAECWLAELLPREAGAPEAAERKRGPRT